MYLWHMAYLPLWENTHRLKKSLAWYRQHLEEAKENAARNGFRGAKWPKQVAYDALDSLSPIATLLLWQQPHIIYLLELACQAGESGELIHEYYEVVKETADYMAEVAVWNKTAGRYELVPPLIPAQEAHNPLHTLNPAFEGNIGALPWTLQLPGRSVWGGGKTAASGRKQLRIWRQLR